MNTWEFATNSCATGKDAADFGCSRFVFHGAIKMRKLATNLRSIGTNIARENRGQKTRHLAMNLHVMGSDIAHADCRQKRGELAANSFVARTSTTDRTTRVISGWAMFQNFYVTDI